MCEVELILNGYRHLFVTLLKHAISFLFGPQKHIINKINFKILKDGIIRLSGNRSALSSSELKQETTSKRRIGGRYIFDHSFRAMPGTNSF